MVLSELPVGNVGSAPDVWFWTWGFGAAAEPLQRLHPCRGSAAVNRPGRPSRPQNVPTWRDILVGNRRQLLPDGGRMSAGSGSHAGASTAALGLRDVRVSRTSVAEPEHFHRGGPNETIAQKGVAHEPIFRFQIAVDLLVFLGR